MGPSSSSPSSLSSFTITCSLQWLFSGFYQNPLMGVLAIFSTGTYAIIGTACVESKHVMKSTTKKNLNLQPLNNVLGVLHPTCYF